MAIASKALCYIFSTNIVVPGQKLTQCRCVSFRMISDNCPANKSKKALGAAVYSQVFDQIELRSVGCVCCQQAPEKVSSAFISLSVQQEIKMCSDLCKINPWQTISINSLPGCKYYRLLKMFAAISFLLHKNWWIFKSHYLHQNQPVLIRHTSLQE